MVWGLADYGTHLHFRVHPLRIDQGLDLAGLHEGHVDPRAAVTEKHP